MYPLEIGFSLVALGFLVAQNVRGLGQKYPYVLLAAGLATIVAIVFLGQMRRQMAPAYLLFAILSLLFLKRSFAHGAIRAVGVACGVLLLAVSVVLAAGLPVAKLQPPAGPHLVGSTSLSLLDESRDNAFFGAAEEKRELYAAATAAGSVSAAEPGGPAVLGLSAAGEPQRLLSRGSRRRYSPRFHR